MKFSRIIMMVTLLLLVPVFALSSELGYMRISFIKGDVQLKTPEAEEWGIGTINTPLGEGDQVWVPEGGIAELQLNGGTYLRLDQNSSLQILSMDRDTSQFYLSQGRAYILYDGPRGSLIQVDTADASTRAFSKSVFRIDVADQYTDVAVLKGYVETENNAGATRINAGRLLSLGMDTEGEFAPLDEPDSWERWNRIRDARVIVRDDGSARFLPAELRSYSPDLDGNGRWVYVPEYGNVWTPTVIRGADWSPYRGGRWLLRNGESVWVADEPWGWVPYHYGRWSFVTGFGWCWVPPEQGEVHWGPGYVGWVRTADYVAWVPLAPGEIYYGRGNYGRHSVNITTVNINQVRVVNVYRNVQFNNGVTIVKRNTFNTTSPAFVRADRDVIRRKIFVTNNINVGAPDIRPSRGAHYPSARSIPSDKLPPLRIRNLQPKVIKHERPLVREHDRSVLAPGAQPRNLPVNRVDAPRTSGKDRPALRQIQPTERGRPEASPSPRPKVEQPQSRPRERKGFGMPVVPAPKGEQPQVKPADQRKPETTPGALPRGERPRVRPVEQGKPSTAPGSTTRGEQPQSRPEERRGFGMPVVPATKVEQPQVKPADQRKPETSPGAHPRGERPPVRPVEQGRPATAPGSSPRTEQPQSRPRERRVPGVPVVPAQRAEQPQAQPAQKGNPETPVRGRRGERQQDKPVEQRKDGASGGQAPKNEKDSPKSEADVPRRR